MQVLCVSLGLFLVYRAVIRSLGPGQLGVWALVTSWVAISGALSLGVPAGVVRFTAKYLAIGDKRSAEAILSTALLFTMVSSSLMVLLAYPLGLHFIPVFFDVVSQERDALRIFPMSLLVFWVSSVASTVLSALDGAHRIKQRTIVWIISTVIFAMLSLLLVQRWQLMGLMYAQVIQYISLFAVGYLFLRPALRINISTCSVSAFRELLAYGSILQIANLCAMAYDPVTKSLIAWFGGAAATGYYEMAQRVIIQLRSVVVSSCQALLPTFASRSFSDAAKQEAGFYETVANITTFFSVPAFTLLVLSLPIVSILWIGSYQPAFVLYGILLAVGWTTNAISAPAYFASLGTGLVRQVAAAHLIMALLNIILGGVGGMLGGPVGVAMGWSMSLTVGSVIHIWAYRRWTMHDGPTFSKISNLRLIVAGLFGYSTAIGLLAKPGSLSITVSAVAIALAGLGWTAWIHPSRVAIWCWATRRDAAASV